MSLPMPIAPDAREEEARKRRALLSMLEDLQEEREIIRQARAQWLETVDAVGHPLMVHDAEFRIVRANRAYAERAGMSFRDLIGRPYWGCFPRRTGPLPECAHCVQSGGPRHATPPGAEEFSLESGESFISHAYPVRDASGRTIHSLHLFEDVTERRRMQTALERSERRFRALIENGSDLVAVLDREGRIVYMSPSIALLGGYRIDEVVGRNYVEFAHPDDVPAARAGLAEIFASPGRSHPNEIRFRHKDGRWLTLESISRNALEDPAVGGIVINARDVTERRQREAQLRLFRTLIDSASVMMQIVDSSTLRFLDVNDAALKALGYGREELLSLSIPDVAIAPPAEMKRITGELERSGTASFEIEHRRKDGSTFPVAVMIRAVELDRTYLVAAVVDITERKRAEAEIKDREARLRTILDTVQTGIMIIDPEVHRIVDVNPATARLIGLPREDIIGKPCQKFVCPADIGKCPITDLGQTVDNSERFLLTAAGERRAILKTAVSMDMGGKLHLLESFVDITERRRSEVQLQLFRMLMDAAPAKLEIVDPATLRYLDCNAAAYDSLGYGREELLAMSVPDVETLSPDELSRIQETIRRTGGATFESMHRRKDGSTLPVEVSARLVEIDRPYGVMVAVDITERKQAEKVLLRANRALRTLSAGNEALVRAQEEHALLAEMCRAVVAVGGYRAALVGYARDDPQKSVQTMAWHGIEGAVVTGLRLSWGDDELGRGAVGRAIRSGELQIVSNAEDDPRQASWREALAAAGVRSELALPLRLDSQRPFGVLYIASSDTDAFGSEEVKLLAEMASDLAFGVATLRTRAERREAGEQLRRSLEDSIQAIAATVERRDPYTAGHQRRVADLAAAIAREMGLEEERVHGLHLAGTIHDLGKIGAPAEILAKPARLSKHEYSLIKEHPQAGHDILGDVHFPWPIARMVLEHHERLDGTGYPRGLEGDAILLESRILAVADVVEAMSSHRPYRPGLGIEKALAEIEKRRGIAYDAAAVDACLKLFRERRFDFDILPGVI